VRWNDIAASTPSSIRMVRGLVQRLGGADSIEPLIAIVTDAANRRAGALLPLIRRWQNGIPIVEFADLDLTDYNAPVLGNAAPRAPGPRAHSARSTKALLPDARRRRPDRLPARFRSILDGRTKSAGAGSRRRAVSAQRQRRDHGDDYDGWRFTLEKNRAQGAGAELALFTRDPAAGSDRTDNDDALRILATTEVQQGTRMQSLVELHSQ